MGGGCRGGRGVVLEGAVAGERRVGNIKEGRINNADDWRAVDTQGDGDAEHRK